MALRMYKNGGWLPIADDFPYNSTVETGVATLNSSYVSSGEIRYYKVGHIVVLSVINIALSQALSINTVIATGIPQAISAQFRAILSTTAGKPLDCYVTEGTIMSAQTGAMTWPAGVAINGQIVYVTSEE